MRVVILDDVLPNAMLFKISMLKVQNVEPVVFSDPKEAIHWCQRNQPDLVLVDYEMPVMNGIAVVEYLRDFPHMMDVPILILTGNRDSALMTACLKAGADDFITKPVEDLLLQARTRSLLRLRTMRRELISTKKKLKSVLGIDTLTNVWTRPRILEELDTSRHAALLADSDVSVILVDVDQMTEINQTFGFDVGDAVLQAVSTAMQNVAGTKPAYGRMGSDEFLCVVSGSTSEMLDSLSSRMHDAVRGLKLPELDGKRPVTVSLVGTQIKSSDKTTTELLGRLTSTMHQCQAQGADQIQIV